MPLLATLEGFFADSAPLGPGEGLVVAFSGGPDSTALLSALTRWGHGRDLPLIAAHLDHGLDPGSRARARAAATTARRLGVPFVTTRRPVAPVRLRGESLEETARRVRYGFLERARREHGARWIATGHHRDDQAETLLLRLRQGSGPAGLGGIAPRLGAVVRPFLELSRSALSTWLERHGPGPVADPTNHDLTRTRNLVRHRILPALERDGERGLAAELARLATTAAAARSALDHRLGRALEPRETRRGVEIERHRLETLPAGLLAPALDLLHRLAGAAHPPSAAARGELARQLARGGAVGWNGGDGWAFSDAGESLLLHRETAARPTPFAYTVGVPGEIALPAGAGRLRIGRRSVEPWMFRPSPTRAGLSLDLEAGDRITVRSRRPGDRIRPFGCHQDRRLKDVLIDRKVPRRERDRLPLLCVGQRVVWVPGVTIAEGCRLAPEGLAWVVEWEK